MNLPVYHHISILNIQTMNTLKALAAATLLFFPIMTQHIIAQGTVIEEIDRTQRPEADAPPKITFPAYETFTLKNGLKVFLVHDPRPSVTMRLLVRGGNSRDGEKTGLADAAADLITKGVGTLSAAEFADQIDFIGGGINASASPDAISVSAFGLKKNLPTVLGLFSKTIQQPTYPKDELDKYIAMQVDGLQANKQEGEFLSTYAVNKVLYGSDSPLGKMPSVEAFQSITRDDVVRYHKQFFIPANATLAVVGDLKQDELKKLLEKELGTWSSTATKPAPLPKVKWQGGGRIVLVDRPTSVQSLVRVIGPGPDFGDPDRPRSFILNSIFGGGTGLGNRLAMNLRETHAYTYTPYSYFAANEFGGHFMAGADVRNSVTDSAIGQIIYEINRIINEPVAPAELELNVQSAVGNYLMSLADPNTTAMRVQSIDFYGLPSNYYDKLVANYTGTTPQEVMRLATKYFIQDEMSVVVVGKASEVKESLEQFGDVEVWDADLNPVKEVSAADLGITAEEAWGKMLTAMGGRENLKKVKSIVQEGTGQFAMGAQKFDGSMKTVQAYPNNSYQELSINGMKVMQQYVDGTNVVVVQQGAKQPIAPEDQSKILAETHILPEAWVQDLGGTLTLKGKKTLNGTDVFLVEMQLPNANPQMYYLDAGTFLPVKIETAELVISYTGWMAVEGGIKQPQGLTLELGPGAALSINSLSYTINGKVEPSAFQPN